MPKIKKLTDEEARKIAAGEVVERPANIVKELVENSIDAGADNISIYIENSGKSLIRVVDNGCGMSQEDAYLCFEHHATSKITSVNDLSSIYSLGFRGEALSSISAISKVKLITSTINEEGICLELEASKIINNDFVSFSKGTDISVNDIFFNVPARLKFLKKDETEWKQILHLFQAFCISYQNIHFKLYHDNQLIYNCPKSNAIKDRLIQLWDNNFAQSMLEISGEDEVIGLTVNGVISNQHFYRYNRNQIFFFVNGRWVKNQNLAKYLIKGYMNVLPQDKFPAAFIFISVPSSDIDINMHPRKEEVQFLYPKRVENLLQNSTKKCLETKLSQSIVYNNNNESMFYAAKPISFDFEPVNFETLESIQNFDFIPQNEYSKEFISPMPIANNIQENVNYKEHHNVAIINNAQESFDIIGQYKKTYILLEKDEGLLFIDQHAAHERILYELFINKFNDIATIKLIFPVVVNLLEEEIDLVMENVDILKDYAIDIERFGKEQLVIKSTPVYLKEINFNELIKQFIECINESAYATEFNNSHKNNKATSDRSLNEIEFSKLVHEKLRAQMACKAAVKAGDVLTNEQMKKLLEDLQKTNNRFTCPHGRPTSWLLSLNEIEKKFKRKL